MKRYLQLPLTVRDGYDSDEIETAGQMAPGRSRYSSRDTARFQRPMRIDVGPTSIQAWCLELSLLERGLADSLTVTNAAQSFKLKIGREDQPSPPRGTVRWHVASAELLLSRTELEYWLHFFLQYYRDGIGSVDHIDVDIPPSESTTSQGLYLTLTIPDARPPLSEEAARRKLGLPLRAARG